MNRISIYLKTYLIIALGIFFISTAAAQPFSKQQLHERLMRSFKERVKTNEQEVVERLRQLQSEAPPTTIQAPARELNTRSADKALSTSKETESEIHAAVNPRDSNNIIVAAMKFTSDNIFGALSFPIYYTKNFGRTWQISQFNGVNDLPPLTLIVGGGDPIVVFDDQGTAYFSWLTLAIGLDFRVKARLHWAISSDGGATWQRQPSFLDEGELTNLANPNGKLPDKEWLAADLHSAAHRGNVYAAYAYINGVDTTYNILVKTKKRNAAEFGPAVDITPEELLFAQFTSIDVDAEGVVHVLFGGATAQDEVISLYHCKSSDGGASFSRPVRISSLHLQCFPPGSDPNCNIVGIDPNRVYPCPHLRVDKSGGAHRGNLYVVWTADGIQSKATEGLDIYYSKSTNGGSTWSAPTVLNDNPDTKTHQFFPSLTVNEEGKVIITWYDRRGDSNNRLTKYFMTISEDGGNTFSDDFSVSSQAADFSVIGQLNGNFGVGEYTQVIATRGYALPFWADGRTNDGNIEVFTTFIALGKDRTTNAEDIVAISDPLRIGALFPNPTQDIATLEVKLQQTANLQVKLFDNAGKVARVYPQRMLDSGEHRLRLDLRGLTSGQYWVVIRSEAGVKTAPLLLK